MQKLSVDCRSNGEILVELTASKDYYNDYETIPDEQIVEDARAGMSKLLNISFINIKTLSELKHGRIF